MCMPLIVISRDVFYDGVWLKFLLDGECRVWSWRILIPSDSILKPSGKLLTQGIWRILTWLFERRTLLNPRFRGTSLLGLVRSMGLV